MRQGNIDVRQQREAMNKQGQANHKKRIDDKKFNKTGVGNREASFKGTRQIIPIFDLQALEKKGTDLK